jgi:hypothetical protein
MGSVWLVAVVELRRRWRSLVPLGSMVAVVAAVVVAALVGAHRTTTSVDRFRADAAASDASFQSEGQFHADGLETAATALPQVEMVAQRHLANAFLIDGNISDIAIMSDPAGRYGELIDRPRVLEGRMPDPAAPDEILLNELAAQSTGLAVGDRLQAMTWSEEDLEALFGGSFPGFNGPRLDLEVVGIGRTLDELPGEVQRTTPYALGSPAFLADHPGLGAWPPAVYVRLHPGDADVAAVSEALGEVPGGPGGSGPGPQYAPADTARSVYLDTARRTADSLAVGLVIFAVAAALAGALVVGQAVVRHVAGSSAPPTTLRQLGESRRHIALGVAAPVAVTALGGALVGVVVAAAASPLLPTGLARRAEPDPGVRIDALVLVPTALAIVVAIVVFAGFAASREHWEPSRRARSLQVPALSRAASRVGARPPILTGVHLAVDRGRGDRAIPVRTAVLALAVGVAGVLGAAVVSTSDHRLDSDPSRWGANWSSMPDTFDTERDMGEAEARLAEDPRLAAVGRYSTGSIVVGDQIMSGYAMAALAGDIGFTRRSGHLPVGPGQVALGAQTMEDLGVSIGDRVTATDPADGTAVELNVVGTAVLPYDEGFTLDVGAVLTPEGLERLLVDETQDTLVLAYPPGGDRAALERDLALDYGFTFTAFSTPNPPGSVRNLAVAADIASVLALFFVVLATLSLLHTLIVSGHRRSLHLAVVRALGFTRSDVRRAVLTQGTVLAILGLVVGVPSGLIVGRLVWRLLVADIGALASPVVPWVVLAVIAPVTLLGVTALSWWPGRAAVRRVPAADLRTE